MPPHDTAQPDDLADLLAHLTFDVMGGLTKVAAGHDLSLTQLRVLAILRDRRRVRMSALAAHLGLDRSSLSGLVQRAEVRGLLRRVPSESDGRAVDVELTASGRRLVTRLRAENAAASTELLERLTAVEQKRLHTLLVRLVDD